MAQENKKIDVDMKKYNQIIKQFRNALSKSKSNT